MKKLLLFPLLCIGLGNMLWAQIPFEIINNTTYAESQVYACVIGLNAANQRVYVNLRTGAQITTSAATNTIAKPGGNGELFGNIFTKLSDIPTNASTGRRTFSLSEISSVRVYFSIGSQLYIKFYDGGGYAGPVYGGPSDVNYGIAFEFIELTYGGNVMYINTSRVDSFNYPIGVELFAANNVYQKSGELKTFAQTGADFLNSMPTEFKGCYDATNGRIVFPTSIPAFQPGGPYENYSKSYIDAIWTKYKTEDLIFNGGGIGIWKGRVDANDKLTLVGQPNLNGSTGPWQGLSGSISRRPTTSEAWNGNGVLNQDNGNNTVDKFLQAQFCAAITRHAIDVATPNVGYQDFQDASRFYVTPPYNYYAKFWHQPGISYKNLSYGFPYDDVADQSSTLAAASPTKTTVYFGGFANLSTNIAVSSVSMSSSTASIVRGGTAQLTGTISPSNATNQTKTWTSSNTAVATVSATGLVTGVATGTATITVTTVDGNKTATCAVTITAAGSLPSPWLTSDIGAVGATGSASYSNSTFTIAGAGADIWNTADQFRYVYQTLNGDGEVVAKVNSLTNTNPWAKAAVMFRETLTTGSINASLVVTPSNGVSYQRRTTTNGTSTNTSVAGQVAPKWLKMKRVGNAFSAYYSADGITWIQVGSSTNISMATSVYVGLCVTSHVDASLCTADINNVSVSSTNGFVAVTGVSLSPSTAALTSGGTRQLTATINPITATTKSVTWSSSNTAVATVSSSGLITAVGAGSTTITVTTTSGSKTAICAVTVSNASCTATGSTGDYTVKVSTSASNPTLTFTPTRTNVGATTCILYYGTSATATLPGYNVTPNTAFTINATSGTKIYFYYTYSVPEGGERNTSANKHNFTVGSCTTLVTARQSDDEEEIVLGKLSIHPNPSTSEIYIENGDPKAEYSVITINGTTLVKGTGDKVDVSHLANGLYFLKVNDSVLRFIKL